MSRLSTKVVQVSTVLPSAMSRRVRENLPIGCWILIEEPSPKIHLRFGDPAGPIDVQIGLSRVIYALSVRRGDDGG